MLGCPSLLSVPFQSSHVPPLEKYCQKTSSSVPCLASSKVKSPPSSRLLDTHCLDPHNKPIDVEDDIMWMSSINAQFSLFIFFFHWHRKLQHVGNYALGDCYSRSCLSSSPEGFSLLAKVGKSFEHPPNVNNISVFCSFRPTSGHWFARMTLFSGPAMDGGPDLDGCWQLRWLKSNGAPGVTADAGRKPSSLNERPMINLRPGVRL